jgi:hypothetical protein
MVTVAGHGQQEGAYLRGRWVADGLPHLRRHTEIDGWSVSAALVVTAEMRGSEIAWVEYQRWVVSDWYGAIKTPRAWMWEA